MLGLAGLLLAGVSNFTSVALGTILAVGADRAHCEMN
jgi:hypothetical protein